MFSYFVCLLPPLHVLFLYSNITQQHISHIAATFLSVGLKLWQKLLTTTQQGAACSVVIVAGGVSASCLSMEWSE